MHRVKSSRLGFICGDSEKKVGGLVTGIVV